MLAEKSGRTGRLGLNLDLPIFESILLFSEFAFKLLKLHVELLNGLSLLVDLLLQGARNLHHILVVLVDLVPRPVHVLLKVVQAERALIQSDIQRGDIATQVTHQLAGKVKWKRCLLLEDQLTE